MDMITVPEDQEKTITPEFLEAHGFARVASGIDTYRDNEDEFESFPCAFSLDIEFSETDLCYLEKKSDRKRFCIVLEPCTYSTGEKYYTFELYIQEDIACGFVNIPNQFTEMTEYHFALIYEGIRREKLSNIKPVQQLDQGLEEIIKKIVNTLTIGDLGTFRCICLHLYKWGFEIEPEGLKRESTGCRFSWKAILAYKSLDHFLNVWPQYH